MKRWIKACALALGLMSIGGSAWAQSVDTPMDFTKKFTGDQNLRFTAAGRPLSPKGTRLNYRLISNAAEWKKVWGYLYDDTLKVDFKDQAIIAIFKSPADGSYDFIPRRVYRFQDNLNVALDVVWNGKTAKSHPFLFLVVKKGFKNLNVEEKYLGPRGKPIRIP
jgi:hypothetical protein